MKETNPYTNSQQASETASTQSPSSKSHPAKRVDIVSLRMVKESSLLYKNRSIKSPEDGYQLFKQFLGELDREYFVVMCLDVKNQPTAINVCLSPSKSPSGQNSPRFLEMAFIFPWRESEN